ncbi:MAG: elongation factor P [Patescibacteria group bacterium]|nr:MAG: elongation factor P [Patescibacteria group bacterium]
MKAYTGDLKKGDFIKLDNQTYQVVETEFNYRGRGSALIKIKLKDITNSNTITKTFKTDEEVELKDVVVKKLTFLYQEGDRFYFLDNDNYEQHETSNKAVAELKGILQEGKDYLCYVADNNILQIKLPNRLKVQVLQTEAGVKGNRVSAGRKPAVVTGGLTIMVPLFISQGDQIIINPETQEYIQRAK